MLNHLISIAVKRPGISEQATIKAGEKRVHRRFLNWLLGDELNVLVISPGSSVRTVEIKEIDSESDSINQHGKGD